MFIFHKIVWYIHFYFQAFNFLILYLFAVLCCLSKKEDMFCNEERYSIWVCWTTLDFPSWCNHKCVRKYIGLHSNHLVNLLLKSVSVVEWTQWISGYLTFLANCFINVKAEFYTLFLYYIIMAFCPTMIGFFYKVSYITW